MGTGTLEPRRRAARMVGVWLVGLSLVSGCPDPEAPPSDTCDAPLGGTVRDIELVPFDDHTPVSEHDYPPIEEGSQGVSMIQGRLLLFGDDLPACTAVEITVRNARTAERLSSFRAPMETHPLDDGRFVTGDIYLLLDDWAHVYELTMVAAGTEVVRRYGTEPGESPPPESSLTLDGDLLQAGVAQLVLRLEWAGPPPDVGPVQLDFDVANIIRVERQNIQSEADVFEVRWDLYGLNPGTTTATASVPSLELKVSTEITVQRR